MGERCKDKTCILFLSHEKKVDGQLIWELDGLFREEI
jgi:hypothetical protein